MPEGNSELTIRSDDGPDTLIALLDWFDHDDALRGQIRLVSVPDGPGWMSAGLYQVLAVALGTSGFASALARSLTTWLTHRRSDVKLTLTRADGATVEIDAARVDPPQLLRELGDLLGPQESGR